MNEKEFIIENDVILNARKIQIGEGSIIKSGTKISAEEIFIGKDTVIENDCTITGFKKDSSLKICIGDDCHINKDVNIAVPVLETGDYVNIHRNTSIFGEKPCIIGHNCWIGQNSILNSSGFLYIGNNVGMGAYSRVWTHVAQGEIIEGCNLSSYDPVIIEDDVWLVGGDIVISPGVKIAKKSCILTGSVLTKSTIQGHCYAGMPAKDITDRVQPYREIQLSEKFQMMKKFVEEYLEFKKSQGFECQKIDDNNCYVKNYCKIYFFNSYDGRFDKENCKEDVLVICERDESGNHSRNITIFDLNKKEYGKVRTVCERDFIRFLKGYRARFAPKNNPKVGLPWLKELSNYAFKEV